MPCFGTRLQAVDVDSKRSKVDKKKNILTKFLDLSKLTKPNQSYKDLTSFHQNHSTGSLSGNTATLRAANPLHLVKTNFKVLFLFSSNVEFQSVFLKILLGERYWGSHYPRLKKIKEVLKSEWLKIIKLQITHR